METMKNCVLSPEEIISSNSLVIVNDDASVFAGELGYVTDVAVGPVTRLPVYEVTLASGRSASFHHDDLVVVRDETDDDAEDNTTSPSHYTSLRFQPKELIVGNEMETCKGNIVKYACRAGSKLYPNLSAPESEVRDLEKVIEYATYRIDHLKEHYIG